MKRQRVLRICVGLVVGILITTTVAAQEIGPENGALVMVGGALQDRLRSRSEASMAVVT